MKDKVYNGCVFAYMFGEWAVLMTEYNGKWILPSAAHKFDDDIRDDMSEIMATRFGMCVPSKDFERSRAVAGWLTAFIDPAGTESGPEIIFDELCAARLRWLPVLRLHRFTDKDTVELVRAELRAQGIRRQLYHMFKSRIKRPVL